MLLCYCRAQPARWTLPVLQAAAASVQLLGSQGAGATAQGGLEATAAHAAHAASAYASAVELARSLVCDTVTRLQCLQQSAATQVCPILYNQINDPLTLRISFGVWLAWLACLQSEPYGAS